MTNPPVFQPRPRRPRPAAATLPAVESRTLLLGVLAGLLLPVAVMVAWMLGVHQLGFELAPVLSSVVLFGLAGLAGLWFVLVRRLGWGLPELGLTRARRSLWHLLWEVPLLIVGSGAVAAGLSTLLGLAKDPSGGSGTDLSMGGIPAALLALTTVLLVPVVEELVFRRLLLGCPDGDSAGRGAHRRGLRAVPRESDDHRPRAAAGPGAHRAAGLARHAVGQHPAPRRQQRHRRGHRAGGDLLKSVAPQKVSDHRRNCRFTPVAAGRG